MINDIEDCVSGQYLRGSQAFISAAFFSDSLRVFKITSFVKTKNCEIRFFTEIDLALLLLHSSREEDKFTDSANYYF